jgi:hypothetical protein
MQDGLCKLVSMRRSIPSLFLLLGLSCAVASAQDFKPYPGAALSPKDSREATAAAAEPGTVSEVYLTSDSYEKVLAFYKGLYKEDQGMPKKGPALVNGQYVKWSFFLLDAGTSLANSKLWLKLQRPYLGGAGGKDIRDITTIQLVRSK